MRSARPVEVEALDGLAREQYLRQILRKHRAVSALIVALEEYHAAGCDPKVLRCPGCPGRRRALAAAS